MDVVADASTCLAVALDEPERASILDATTGVELMAPEVLPFEIGNALIAMRRRGRLDEEEVFQTWASAQQIPVQLVPVEVEPALALAMDSQVYAYDAYYLQCCLAYRRPLITLDHRMRAVAETLGIRILL